MTSGKIVTADRKRLFFWLLSVVVGAAVAGWGAARWKAHRRNLAAVDSGRTAAEVTAEYRRLSGEVLTKTALLLLPGAGTQDAIVEFRWDEDEPLSIDVWPRGKNLSTRGRLSVFSEDDREVPASYVISDPTVTRSRSVKRGELLRLYLDYTEVHDLPRGGHYYAIASFGGWSGDRSVSFVTKKRWFTVERK